MRTFCIKQLGKCVLDLFKIFYSLFARTRRTHLVKVYFFQVDGCARHLRNPATKCELPIG
jgi:hypothetical protein